jgi:hypothetical protein
MADTLGGLIDKLHTSNLKMWNNQEILYEIRRMSFDQFRDKYGSSAGLEQLWQCLQKVCDMNLQRNALIDEIDEKLIAMIRAGVSGTELDDGRNVQRKHKTY